MQDENTSEGALDNPVWSSLVGGHCEFALGRDTGSGAARRYPATIGPFAGLRENTFEAFKDLEQLVPAGDAVAVLFDSDPVVPQNWSLLRTLDLVQMIHRTASEDRSIGQEIVRLTPHDFPEMVSLAKLTEPGPFSSETARLGAFFGIRMNGKLVAMAGQRFKPPGFVEVSAVCTHPDYRGRGLAAGLVCKVVEEIQAANAVPFLTCMETNTGAIKLYKTLGFTYRRSFVLQVLRIEAR